MDGDKIVIELDGVKLALDTAVIDGIVEVERIPFLPGQSGIVNGIISLRNEPVTVIDIRRVFSGPPAPEKTVEGGPHKIIVVRGKNRLIGFDIGGAPVSFLWEEELKGRVALRHGEYPGYVSGKIDEGENPIRIIDWAALFNEAARLLSAEEPGA